jgi:hypothetical protein
MVIPKDQTKDDDRLYTAAQMKVLQCLKLASDQSGQGMVVISNLEFGDFLEKEEDDDDAGRRKNCYAATVEAIANHLSDKDHNARTHTARLQHAKLNRADFDVLMLHKSGLLAGQIRSFKVSLHILGSVYQVLVESICSFCAVDSAS